MPTNFPEVWLKRVERNLTGAEEAPFLDGIAELDTPVIEVGEGSASEQNIIHIPVSDFKPDVLINNSAYPLALQAYTDTDSTIQLDKYQTKQVSLTDDQAIGASYARIDNATRGATLAILETKFQKAIHAISPASNAAATPVLECTGSVVAAEGNRKRLTYNDLVALKNACDNANPVIPATGRRLVLSTAHYNDLLLDRNNFGNLLLDYNNGKTAPVLAGFKIYSYIYNPYFTNAGVRNAFAAVPISTDRRASIAFVESNIAKKTGMTKQYFSDAKSDPANQMNVLAYRHYFIATNKRTQHIAALY